MFNFHKKVLIFSHLFAAIWESETKFHKIHLHALFWFKLGPDQTYTNRLCSKSHLLPGDNTEKIWVHWFLASPKTIAAGEGFREMPCPAPIFLKYKHTKTVIDRVNIG